MVFSDMHENFMDSVIAAAVWTAGATLIIVGALIAVALLVLSLLPSGWRRTAGAVAQTDGERAVVKYNSGHETEHIAHMYLPGVGEGQSVDLVYKLDAPATYDHAGVRRTTLLIVGIPIACASMVCGAALAAIV